MTKLVCIALAPVILLARAATCRADMEGDTISCQEPQSLWAFAASNIVGSRS